jgi:hypothetical protein
MTPRTEAGRALLAFPFLDGDDAVLDLSATRHRGLLASQRPL